MKKDLIKRVSLLLALVLAMALAGCSQNDGGTPSSSDSPSIQTSSISSQSVHSEPEESTPESDLSSEEGATEEEVTPSATELTVRFGDDGAPFTMHLYDNETAAAIARHVGTADWRLPIYNYDNFENWEVMQFYDIPSRYEIPSNPESITQEWAGAVYYSEPNRIVLFYHEAQVSGEYTPVGYFDYTDEFVAAVEENPVLEGWGNKIIQISSEA